MPHIGFDLRQRDPPDIPGPHKTRDRKGGPASPNNRYGARCEGAASWPSGEGVWVALPIIPGV